MIFPLLPFGMEVGDDHLQPLNDGCASVFLSVSFPFLGTNESNVFVSDSNYHNIHQWHCRTNFRGFVPPKKIVGS